MAGHNTDTTVEDESIKLYEARLKKIGQLMSVVAASAVGIIGGVAFITTFPQFGILSALAIGLGGLIVEGNVYWDDTPSAAIIIFSRGMMASVADKIIKRELRIDAYHQLYPHYSRQQLADMVNGRKPWAMEIEHHTKDLVESKLKDRACVQYLKSQFAKEIALKQRATWLALGVAIGAGFGFGSMTFTHASVALAVLFHQPALAVLIPYLAFTFAVAATFAFGMLQYTTLTSAIVNDLPQRVYHSMKNTFVADDWQSMNTRQRLRHIASAFLMAVGFAVISGICITMALTEGSAWIAASAATLSLLTTASMAASLASLLIMSTFIPAMFVFAFKNSWWSLNYISNTLASTADSIGEFMQTSYSQFKSAANYSQFFSNSIGALRARFSRDHASANYKLLFGKFIMVSIVLLLMGLHYLGEAAVAGEGVDQATGRFERLFSSVSLWFSNTFGWQMSPQLIAASSTFTTEAMVDTPFVLKNSFKQHVPEDEHEHGIELDDDNEAHDHGSGWVHSGADFIADSFDFIGRTLGIVAPPSKRSSPLLDLAEGRTQAGVVTTLTAGHPAGSEAGELPQQCATTNVGIAVNGQNT